MKIVQINSVCGSGSTGKICVSISELLSQKGIENYILYASGNSDYPFGRRYMSSWEVKWNAGISRVMGNWGFTSAAATKRLIAELNKIRPDIVHLHNLHAHNVHLGLLFSYLKKNKTKIIWTFHDCWAFTGYCPHYDMIGCERWKNGCRNCSQRRHFSWFFDRSSYVYQKKKELFTGLNMTIVAPSQWMADQVKQSFLSAYPVRVINNGIDLEVFKPRESDFRTKYGLEDKFILLGVAFGWGVRKGLDVFIELSKRLDERFQIVLVGTDTSIDKQLPQNIISIHRTQNQIELAEIYTAADLFVNPTREENYPTVNMESLACGTPVVTFDTGGSPEIVDEFCGRVVERDNLDILRDEIVSLCNERELHKENCLLRAQTFSADDNLKNYEDLYLKEIVE